MSVDDQLFELFKPYRSVEPAGEWRYLGEGEPPGVDELTKHLRKMGVAPKRMEKLLAAAARKYQTPLVRWTDGILRVVSNYGHLDGEAYFHLSLDKTGKVRERDLEKFEEAFLSPLGRKEVTRSKPPGARAYHLSIVRPWGGAEA